MIKTKHFAITKTLLGGEPDRNARHVYLGFADRPFVTINAAMEEWGPHHDLVMNAITRAMAEAEQNGLVEVWEREKRENGLR